MLNVNLYGTSFAHHEAPFSSCLNKASEYINWDLSLNSDVSIHVDDGLFMEGSPNVPKERRFGWLHEAESITPQYYVNATRVLDYYECIFTHSGSLLRLDDRFKGPIPLSGCWIDEPKIHSKTKMVSMVASNKNQIPGHIYRTLWTQKLQGKLDFFGRGFKEIEKKEYALNDYMFSVAIENNGFGMASEHYFTEKLIDCFATGTIPIYFGCSNIETFFNPDGVIQLDHTFDPSALTEDLYYSKMDAIKDNFERCHQYYPTEDYIYVKYLQDMNLMWKG